MTGRSRRAVKAMLVRAFPKTLSGTDSGSKAFATRSVRTYNYNNDNNSINNSNKNNDNNDNILYIYIYIHTYMDNDDVVTCLMVMVCD